MMRIISGSARGTRLATLDGENTRPTLERVKEALFSMIQFEIADARVLDLFAGSGQLALEALSRGAVNADAVDSSNEANRIIKQNIEKTHMEQKCRLWKMTSDAFLRANAGRREYDLVFLDPPYAKGLIPDSLTALDKGGMLSTGAVVVCELSASDNENDILTSDALRTCYTVRKNASYARARIIILDYVKEDGNAKQ
jgi:16S rRNA (guanine(966)-N(2))-methyltransferase RsmD